MLGYFITKTAERALISNSRKLILIFGKIWKEFNNQVEVVQETNFTKFQLIPLKCLHAICICGVVLQEKM